MLNYQPKVGDKVFYRIGDWPHVGENGENGRGRVVAVFEDGDIRTDMDGVRSRGTFSDTEEGLDNLRRIDRAKCAVLAYKPDDAESVIRDLLCDLMHLCQNEGIMFEEELCVARDFFLGEVEQPVG